MFKSKSILIRLSDHDYNVLSVKSLIFKTDKSKLLRDSALSYWDSHGDDFDSEEIIKLYKSGDEVVKGSVVDILFEYYRRTGYPHRKLSTYQMEQEMQKISVTKDPLLDNDHLQINSCGITLPNFFHPHMVKVRNKTGNRSPYGQYISDDFLKDAIKRWLDLGKNVNPSGIRRILKIRDGVKGVVNFKPAISKYFYDNYVPRNGVVLDPCSGYSGRLSGCIATNKNLLYHGIDPCSNTATGNMKMAGYFGSLYSAIEKTPKWSFRFRFDLGCAEDVMPLLKEEYDLIFTSPPYFDVEEYESLPNQSYIRYPEYDKWRDDFLGVIIKESFRLCKVGGYVILNVKNYKKYPIADDTLSIAENVGLKLIKTYQMRMTNVEFRLKDNDMWHSEPIYVFKRV